MKITKEKLQQLIREELEAYSQTVEEEVVTEDVGMVLSAAAGTVLGILGLGVGLKAYGNAKRAWSNFKYEREKEAHAIEYRLRRELESREAKRLHKELMNDKELIQLIDIYSEIKGIVDDAKGQGIRTPTMAAFRKLAPKLSKMTTEKLNNKALELMSQSPELKALSKAGGSTQHAAIKRASQATKRQMADPETNPLRLGDDEAM